MGMPTALRGLDPSAKTAQVVLQADGLTKHYGPVIALERLDLGLNAGEVLGYLGPNGAGKTTTIRLLLGLIRPTAGRARIFGMDTQDDKVAVHARTAYVPGEATLWPSLTGAETLHLLARVHGRPTSPTGTSSSRDSTSTRPGRSGRTPKATGRRSTSSLPCPAGLTCSSSTSPRPASTR
jgi:ABC-type sugar transport system ATPase subunit